MSISLQESSEENSENQESIHEETSTSEQDLLAEEVDAPSTSSELLSGLSLVVIGGVISHFASRRLNRYFQPLKPWSLKLEPLVLFEVFMIFFGLMLLGGSLIQQLKGNTEIPQHTQVLSGHGIMTAINALVIGYILFRNRFAGGSLKDLGWGVQPPKPTNLFVLFGISLGLYVAFAPLWIGVSLLQEIIVEAFGGTIPKQEAVTALEENDKVSSNAFFLFGVCVTTPIFEEILFRGFLYGMVRRKLGPTGALLATSTFFMLVHDAGQVQVFLLGLYLAWLYERTRSLTVPIAIHMWHNGLTVLTIHLLPVFGVTP